LVSCIMPTADRRAFVPQSIGLFQAQDYPERELVVLDSGAETIADLIPPDPRIRYIRDTTRRALGARRNQACEAARGEILMHWDDDDWYAPWRISYQAAALQEAGADICGIDRVYYLDEDRHLAWQYAYPRAPAPWVCGPTLCYRRDFWRAQPFRHLHIGEDTHFVRAAAPERIAVLPETGFFVGRVHGDNTSPKQTQMPPWRSLPFGEVMAIKSAVAPVAASCARPAVVAAGGGIGDILRITPLIRVLHRRGYEVDLLLLADEPAVAELLRGAPELREVTVLSGGRGPQHAPDAHYQLAIANGFGAPLLRRVQAAQVIQYDRTLWLRDGDTACCAQIAAALGWQGALPPPFALASARNFSLPAGTIALHPGCKPDWPWKRWHGFAELAASLPDVVIIGTPADLDNRGTYFSYPFAWPAHAQNYCGTLSLADTAALLGQCAALVANDSGLMHLAVALGVPSFGIFGITSPAREGMTDPHFAPISKGLACEPDCRAGSWGRRDCAQHLACLKTLTADDVLTRLRKAMPERAVFSSATKVQVMSLDTINKPAEHSVTETFCLGPARADRLRLAIRMEGGLGDVVVAARLVEAAFHAFDHPQIDLFYHQPETARFVFHGSRCVHAVHDERARTPPRGYDVSLYTLHFPHFTVHDEARLRRLCPDAAATLERAATRFAAYRGLCDRRPALDGLWGRLSVRQGRNILDNLGFLSGLEIDRDTQAALSPDVAALESIKALLSGIPGPYVTVHDGFDNATQIPPGRATKCWPLEAWQQLVASLRAQRPELRIIQLGAVKSRNIPGVDRNLVGRTSLHQAAWILQAAALHIDTDSGLVHLASAMHVPSVVLFGPTDAGLYGYEQNANLRAGGCGECWWSTPDWLSRCPRGLATPACMEAITPEHVATEALARLKKITRPRARLIASSLYDPALLKTDAQHLRDIFTRSGLQPVPISAHAYAPETGIYLHASKQWEYLFALQAIRHFPRKRQQTLRVLDAGGGRGALPVYLAQCDHEVELFDRDFLWDNRGDAGIERRYMRTAAAKGVKIRYGSIYNLPAPSENYDVVTCISVVEHLPTKAVILRELLRVLRPGGILVLTFDIAAAPAAMEDDLRVEIFSPERLQKFLGEIGHAAAPFSNAQTLASAQIIARDGVAGIPKGMSVGGIVLQK
jgi:ADP-heptose:LPS heptosyltransferase/SAM-dependent methyltransferase